MTRLFSARNTISALVVANLGFAAIIVSAGCEKKSEADETATEPATAVATERPAATLTTAAVETTDEEPSCAGMKNAVAEGEEASCGSKDGAAGAKDGAAGGCNQWDEAAGKVIERSVPENATWATLKVTGMTCGGCERRVIAKVGGLDGVYSVEADAELGQVRVAMDKSKPKLAGVAETINSLGYRVQ